MEGVLMTATIRDGAPTKHAGARAGGRHWNRVADFLVADRHYFHQVCDPDHACQQPRRGRDLGPPCVGEPASRQEQPAASLDGRGDFRLSSAPAMVALRTVRPGNRRYGDRLAINHLRRLLAHESSYSTRLSTAH